jgi:hypothetical protein
MFFLSLRAPTSAADWAQKKPIRLATVRLKTFFGLMVRIL